MREALEQHFPIFLGHAVPQHERFVHAEELSTGCDDEVRGNELRRG
jgi:hypothetical protein